MLLERDDALAAVGDAVSGAASGRGRVVVVEAAAGLGKSALLAVARQRGAAAGLRVLTATGGEIEREIPWVVARELLRPVLPEAGVRHPAAAAALGHGRADVEDPLAPLQPLTELCAELAEQRPLLLLVDDAHWADVGSARWLAYLAARVPELPLALVVSARPTDPRRPEALDRLGQRDGVRTVPLSALSPEAVGRLVREAVPAADAPLCSACWEATSGNPFLVAELVRELGDATAPTPGLVQELALAGVGRALRRRLGAAGEQATSLARAVAVLGAECDAYDAVALAGLDREAGAAAADVLRAADLLVDRGLGRVAFAHPLLRVAAERAVPTGRRSLLHLQAARHLARSAGTVQQVGAQLLAVEPADDPWVREQLVAAADEAQAAAAPATAKALLERALAERVAADVPALQARLGLVALHVDPPAAVEPLRAALGATAEPEERVQLAVALAGALQAVRRPSEICRLLIDLQEELRHAAAPEGLWWRVQGELLNHSFLDVSAREQRRGWLDAACARLSGRYAEEHLVLVQLAVEQYQRGTADGVSAAAERAWGGGALLRAGASPVVLSSLLYCFLYGDRPDRAEELANEWLAGLRSGQSRMREVPLTAIKAEIACRQGDLRDSEAHALAAWTLAREVGRGYVGWWMAVATLAQALVHRGRPEQARSLLAAEGLLDAPAPQVWLMPSLDVVRAEVLLACGDLVGGVRELEQVDAWLTSLDLPSPGAWWYPARLVEALLRLDRRDRAREVARTWRAATASYGSRTVDGIALRSLGLAEPSVELLEQAEQLLAASSARLEHARALLELGAALRRVGSRAAAREKLRAALDLAVRLGADSVAARARDELRAAGGQPRRPAVTGVDALTASELRVVRLAAEGHSNPEIAAVLYVTRKTVEKHLSAAFDKLQVSSRRELAALLPQVDGAPTSGSSMPTAETSQP